MNAKSARQSVCVLVLLLCSCTAIAGTGTDTEIDQLLVYKERPLGIACSYTIGLYQQFRLQDLLALALCNNSQVRVSIADRRVKVQALAQVSAGRLPDITAALSKVRESVDRDGSHESSSARVSNLQLNWRVYDFGVLGGRIEASRSEVDLASASLDEAILKTALSVVESYFRMATAHQSLLSLQVSEQVLIENLNSTQKKMASGLVSRSEILSATLTLTKTRIELVAIAAQSQQELIRLNTAVGALLTVDNLVWPSQWPQVKELESARLPLSDQLEAAQFNAPSVVVSLHGLAQARHQLKAVKAETLPSLDYSLIRSINGRANQSLTPDQRQLTHNLTLTIPISAGLYKNQPSKVAAENVTLRLEQLSQARKAVDVQISGTFNNLQKAKESLEISASLVDTTKNLVNSALTRLRAGLIDQLELNQIISTNHDALNQYWRSMADVVISQQTLGLVGGETKTLLDLLNRNNPISR